MNKQEVFDKVAKHLLTQKIKCVDSTGRCVYRGINGLKCAIGCLIPDDVYEPSMEGFVIHHWFGNTSLSGDGPNRKTSIDWMKPAAMNDLLQSLQLIHDGYTPNEWQKQLKNVAKKHELTFNESEYV